MRSLSLILVATVAAAGLSACNSNRNVMAAQTPDEFLVLARAPLVLPPDYGLRPPMPGEPRPQDLNPEATARTALIGQRSAIVNAGSEGERLLMIKSKADQADPRIKEVIDDEQGDIAHKTPSFVNRLLFANPGTTTVVQPSPGDAAAPLDPVAEAARLQSLTGGRAITIQKTAPAPEKRGFKLPGL